MPSAARRHGGTSSPWNIHRRAFRPRLRSRRGEPSRNEAHHCSAGNGPSRPQRMRFFPFASLGGIGGAMPRTTIVAEEAERFGRLAADWWDPDGSSSMLHKLNPVRLKYIRDQIDQHWQVDECSRRPLEGKTALDVGCGAGLLTEPLARLGAKVTGIDASPEVIAVARDHADAVGLD